MRRLKVIHIDSGRILGEILEMVQVDGELEYVVQYKTSKFFIKANNKLIVRQ